MIDSATLHAETKQAVPVYSFGSLIDGHSTDTGEWVHVMSGAAMLGDSFATVSVKRQLDAGALSVDEVAAGTVVGRVSAANGEDIRLSLEAAARAARVWRSAPLKDRLDGYLELMAERIRANRQAIIMMLTLEGHPIELAKWEYSGLISSCSEQNRSFLRNQLWQEFRDGQRRQIVRRQPDGVVCVNPPANAPMASILMSSLALVAGNSMVFRVPRSVPLGAMYAVHDLIAPTLSDLGAPAGTVNALCADPETVMSEWISSPHVSDIMYFGSSSKGLEVEQKCVSAGKKPVLELAGNDTVVVWLDADPEFAGQAICEAFFGSGQLCMIPNRVIVHPDIADRLLQVVEATASSLKPGLPDHDGTLLSPVLRQEKYFEFLDDAVAKGATVVSGGRRLGLDGSEDSAGFFLEPTIIRIDGTERSISVKAVTEETFFPLLPIVVPENDEDDALLTQFIDFTNENRYGLRNSIWGSDEAVVQSYIDNVTNGGLLKVNDSHIAFSSPLPTHGGTGLTGGAFGEANYPALRTSHIQGVSILDGTVPPDYKAEYPNA